MPKGKPQNPLKGAHLTACQKISKSVLEGLPGTTGRDAKGAKAQLKGNLYGGAKDPPYKALASRRELGRNQRHSNQETHGDATGAIRTVLHADDGT